VEWRGKIFFVYSYHLIMTDGEAAFFPFGIFGRLDGPDFRASAEDFPFLQNTKIVSPPLQWIPRFFTGSVKCTQLHLVPRL
jgi:hypothetical protein